jgi:hypothetical protein
LKSAALKFAGLVFFAASSSSVFGCRCTEPMPRQAYRAADAAVDGEITDVQHDTDSDTFIYKVSVSESWKKKLSGEITVHSSTSCAFEATAKTKLVMFLKIYDQTRYETGMCMGNKTGKDALPVLKYLRRPRLHFKK